MNQKQIEFVDRQLHELENIAGILYGEWQKQDMEDVIMQLEDILEQADKIIQYIEKEEI